MSIAAMLGRAVGELVGSFGAAKQSQLEAGAIAQTGGLYRPIGTVGVAAPATLVSDADRYATSDDVYAAVSLLANNAANVPFRVTVDGEDAPDHELALLLRRCNRRQGGGRQVWKRFYSWWWLTGESYLYIERSNPLDPDLPNVIYALSGSTIDPVLGADGYVGHYVIHRPYQRLGERVDLPDVVPCVDFNPNDPLRGLSPIASARLGLDTEAAAKSANRDIFANGLMAGAMFSPRNDEHFSPTQADQLRDSIQKRHVGDGKRHGMLFVPLPVTVEKLALTPHDAEFIEQDKLTTKDIAKVYNIPPMCLGQFDDATLSNYKIAYRAFWEMAVLPRVSDLCELLNNYLSPQYPDSPVVSADTAGIEALREDAKIEADAVNVWVRAGFDRRWAAERVTGDPIPDDAISELVPVSLRDPQATPAGVPPSALAGGPAPRTKATTEAIASVREAAMAEAMPAMQAALDEAFGEQGAMVIAALDTAWAVTRAARAKSRRRRALTVDEMVAVVMPEWDDDPMAAVIHEAISAGVTAGAEGGNELFELGVEAGRVLESSEEWIATTAAADVRHINETTRGLLRAAMAEGLALGEDVRAVTRRVEAAFGLSDEPDELTRYRNRARAITETELGTGYCHGSNAAIEAVGLNREWRSVLGLTTRPEHAAAHGQIRAPGQLFVLAGYPCMYPMDPSLPPEHRVYCHCDVAATEQEPTA